MVPIAVHEEQIAPAFNEALLITKPVFCLEDFVATRIYCIFLVLSFSLKSVLVKCLETKVLIQFDKY